MSDCDASTSSSTIIHHQHSTKRVSFGEQPVKTFVYEKEISDSIYPSRSSPIVKQPFTSLDSPPNKVTVTSERGSELPNPISPPSSLDYSVSLDRRQQSQHLSSPNHHHNPTFVVSPPLPALVNRMENEHDNPFRPEDELYHQVDPIVEAYKTKPYPRGYSSPQKLKNGSGGGDSKSADRSGKYSTNLLQYTEADGLTTDGVGKRGTISQPKAGKAELVHVDDETTGSGGKRRGKCGCCSVQ